MALQASGIPQLDRILGGGISAGARQFEMDLETPIRQGRTRIMYDRWVDFGVDQLMHELDRSLEHERPDRFVLDGVEELLSGVEEQTRPRPLLHVLASMVRSRSITAMFTVAVRNGVGPELDLERTPMAALAHTLVLLRYVEYRQELHRILSIPKSRDSDFDSSIRRYVISSRGRRILAVADAPSDLLAGLSCEARVKQSAEPEDGS
jgi:circadian clock protein KaiC